MENRWKRLHGSPDRLLNSSNAEIFFNAATNEPIAVGYYVDNDYFLAALGETHKVEGRLAAIKVMEDLLKG